jgi:NosR/NirI family transcriptional regulator, nitrous oxide reductase regulator
MRAGALAVLLLVSAVIAADDQPPIDPALQAQLAKILPSAASFSPKSGEPPHFKAFVPDPRTGALVLTGLAFWTTELEPLERGYDGPIKMLVGMDANGILTGVLIVEHHEPYGNFSIDLPAFSAQFSGKNIRDPFRVGADIDAVSRATITVSSAARAVRNSARRVARQLLVPPAQK